MIDIAINKLNNKEDLDEKTVEGVFDLILDGQMDEEKTALLLKLLAQKKESPIEIAFAAESMRKHADMLNADMALLDTCGTGGDGKATFNISTAAGIVCSVFVPVAKHGNKAVSSKSGSADVLEALGVKIDRKKDEAYRFLKDKNFTFLFAPFYHPAMKNVAGVRKKLGIRTIFNLLGPLCNPFNPLYQVIGVFSEDFLHTMFEASALLGMDDVIFVSSKDGLDEVSLSDVTVCYKRERLNEEVFEFDPREFGIYADIKEIKGGDAIKNARLMVEMFKGEHKSLQNAVAINAAFGLVISGVESDLKKAFTLAKETITNGRAYEKLEEIRG